MKRKPTPPKRTASSLPNLWYLACTSCTTKLYSVKKLRVCPRCGMKLLPAVATKLPWQR